MKFQKGLLDLKTFSDRDISKYDYERALDFLNTKIQPASVFGFNNLCMVQQDNLNFEVEQEINQSFASCADYVKKKKTIFKNKWVIIIIILMLLFWVWNYVRFEPAPQPWLLFGAKWSSLFQALKFECCRLRVGRYCFGFVSFGRAFWVFGFRVKVVEFGCLSFGWRGLLCRGVLVWVLDFLCWVFRCVFWG